MTTSQVLDHLRACGLVVVVQRNGAKVQCPAHHDKRPSLDVTEGRDGRTLMICRAGCAISDVLAGAGLTLFDLFTEHTSTTRPRAPQSPIELARAEAVALARRQPWTRHLDRYAAADAIRLADQVRRQAQESDYEVWETLAEAAALTSAAENVLAGQ